MASSSRIEWTDATWQPITGCSIVSPGCRECYAMKLAGTRLRHHSSRAGLTVDSKAGPVWTGEVRFNAEWLMQPLQWKRPRRIFVCAHGDLFHEGVPDEWIDQVFAVMALARQHTFQVLTKRADRMKAYLSRAVDWDLTLGAAFTASQSRTVIAERARELDHRLGDLTWPLPNVLLGVSAERQVEADERVPLLLETPAAVRFVSAEPLLGPIDLTALSLKGVLSPFDALSHGATYTPDAIINGRKTDRRFYHFSGNPTLDWVIAGGESGSNARPMHLDSARSLRDQCSAAGVPFFFKQWGEYLPVGQTLPNYGKIHGGTAVSPGKMRLHYGGKPQQEPEHAFAEFGVKFASTADGRLTFRVGKATAGRLLDGVEHDGMPEVG